MFMLYIENLAVFLLAVNVDTESWGLDSSVFLALVTLKS